MMTFTVIRTKTNRKSYPHLLVNSMPANFITSRRSKKLGRELKKRKKKLIMNFLRGRGEKRKNSIKTRKRKVFTKLKSKSPKKKFGAVVLANFKVERTDKLSEHL
jgi:hypothetical protein